ncbi:RloB domain-containing protein [Bifidobacterium sp. MA2]|uniref:RloB domain-containing protein n=1 Tax=Bifidobacterium santillanense TaxID=2809028 RepID=A0ABS5UQR9_9BIFI|nr:RloB family protein [Bifidobacterium santillanense]MBT1173183.1 RloB domain-containing protein [Bifidobacterium santillanense]
MSRKKTTLPPHGRKTRRSNRVRARRYLVVCGGEVTEHQYFEYLETTMKDVVITVISKTLAPAQLADYAMELKHDDERDNDDPRDRYACVFVVVDVDDFHDHAQAQRTCTRSGMHLVISNPCFEVWLIDHVRSCPPSYTITADVEKYAAKLQVTTGPRNKYINLTLVEGHIQDAIGNAHRHNSSEKAVLRHQLIPRKASDYAPWTDMAGVIEILNADSM